MNRAAGGGHHQQHGGGGGGGGGAPSSHAAPPRRYVTLRWDVLILFGIVTCLSSALMGSVLLPGGGVGGGGNFMFWTTVPPNSGGTSSSSSSAAADFCLSLVAPYESSSSSFSSSSSAVDAPVGSGYRSEVGGGIIPMRLPDVPHPRISIEKETKTGKAKVGDTRREKKAEGEGASDNRDEEPASADNTATVAASATQRQSTDGDADDEQHHAGDATTTTAAAGKELNKKIGGGKDAPSSPSSKTSSLSNTANITTRAVGDETVIIHEQVLSNARIVDETSMIPTPAVLLKAVRGEVSLLALLDEQQREIEKLEASAAAAPAGAGTQKAGGAADVRKQGKSILASEDTTTSTSSTLSSSNSSTDIAGEESAALPFNADTAERATQTLLAKVDDLMFFIAQSTQGLADHDSYLILRRLLVGRLLQARRNFVLHGGTGNIANPNPSPAPIAAGAGSAPGKAVVQGGEGAGGEASESQNTKTSLSLMLMGGDGGASTGGENAARRTSCFQFVRDDQKPSDAISRVPCVPWAEGAPTARAAVQGRFGLVTYFHHISPPALSSASEASAKEGTPADATSTLFPHMPSTMRQPQERPTGRAPLRVGVEMSGQMRTYRRCYQTLVDNVLRPNHALLFIASYMDIGDKRFGVRVAERDISAPIAEVAEMYAPFLAAMYTADLPTVARRLAVEFPTLFTQSQWSWMIYQIFMMDLAHTLVLKHPMGTRWSDAEHPPVAINLDPPVVVGDGEESGQQGGRGNLHNKNSSNSRSTIKDSRRGRIVIPRFNKLNKIDMKRYFFAERPWAGFDVVVRVRPDLYILGPVWIRSLTPTTAVFNFSCGGHVYSEPFARNELLRTPHHPVHEWLLDPISDHTAVGFTRQVTSFFEMYKDARAMTPKYQEKIIFFFANTVERMWTQHTARKKLDVKKIFGWHIMLRNPDKFLNSSFVMAKTKRRRELMLKVFAVTDPATVGCPHTDGTMVTLPPKPRGRKKGGSPPPPAPGGK